MSVRVLRIIEITYPDFATYENDRAHWALPANGTKQFGAYDVTYTTATLGPETIGAAA